MKTFDVDVRRTIVVTEQDVDDIMCTALEGGINYWCDSAYVVGEYKKEWAHEQIARGGGLILHDMEDDETFLLTIDKFLDGIKMAYENSWFMDYGWCDGSKLDTCQVDAEVADTIIQYALFNEVIYG